MKPTTPPKDTAETWEERFDKKFDDNPVFWAELNSEFYYGDVDIKPFKTFIKEELAHLLEEVENEIEWNVGTVIYDNPDGKKIKALNAEHVQEVLTQLRKKYNI